MDKIRKILAESVLTEQLVNIILVKENNKYVLYNVVDNTIYGYGKISESNSGYVIINDVAAKKGYGYIVHDIIMMDNFPKDIMADDTLTSAEIGIWEYYFNNRNDVNKSRVPDSSIGKLKLYDEDGLLYSYRQEPKQWFKDLLNVSKKNIYENGLDVGEIIILGENYFNERYGEQF